MPKLSTSLPKYRRHRASGQAVVTLSGRDFYLGPYGTATSKRSYDRKIAEWLQGDRRSSPANDPEQISVTSLCARYLRFAQTYYRKDGECTGVVPGVKCAIKYLRLWYGATPAADFGPLALKAVRQKMIEDGLSRKYINDHVARIKRIWKWGVGEQLVSAMTLQALAAVPGLARGRTAARETMPVQPVDDAVVDATLPHLPPVVADLVRLQRLTGMRPDEACRIRPCEIDRSGEVWLYRPTRHKTQHHGRERTVYIGIEGQGVLSPYLDRDAETFCFRPVDSEGKRRAAVHGARTTPLSCGNRPGSNRKVRPKKQPGDRYDTDAYRRAITRACDKAFPHPTLSTSKLNELTPGEREELARWRCDHHWAPNQLRHAFATRVRRDFGLEAAQVALGHSSAQVTQIYAERDVAKGVEVAKAIG